MQFFIQRNSEIQILSWNLSCLSFQTCTLQKFPLCTKTNLLPFPINGGGITFVSGHVCFCLSVVQFRQLSRKCTYWYQWNLMGRKSAWRAWNEYISSWPIFLLIPSHALSATTTSAVFLSLQRPTCLDWYTSHPVLCFGKQYWSGCIKVKCYR